MYMITYGHVYDNISGQNCAAKNIIPFYLDPIVKKIHLVE